MCIEFNETDAAQDRAIVAAKITAAPHTCPRPKAGIRGGQRRAWMAKKECPESPTGRHEYEADPSGDGCVVACVYCGHVQAPDSPVDEPATPEAPKVLAVGESVVLVTEDTAVEFTLREHDVVIRCKSSSNRPLFPRGKFHYSVAEARKVYARLVKNGFTRF